MFEVIFEVLLLIIMAVFEVELIVMIWFGACQPLIDECKERKKYE